MTDQVTETITITPAAAQAVKELIAQRSLEGYALRLFVQGGGCSGFQYGMALDNRTLDKDSSFEMHGLKIMVDDMSINYLYGATVDYVDTETGKGFKISNPNIVSGCGGCGSHGEGCGGEDESHSGGCCGN